MCSQRLRSFLRLFTLGLLALGCLRAQEWQLDTSDALEAAANEQKGLLILFTDSEDCAACKKLEHEILGADRFQAFARESLVLLMIPCTLKSGGQAKYPELGHEVLRKFLAVDRYPTWWLLNHEQAPLLYGGYQSGGADPFVALIESSLKENKVNDETHRKTSDFLARLRAHLSKQTTD